MSIQCEITILWARSREKTKHLLSVAHYCNPTRSIKENKKRKQDAMKAATDKELDLPFKPSSLVIFPDRSLDSPRGLTSWRRHPGLVLPGKKPPAPRTLKPALFHAHASNSKASGKS